MPRPIDVYTQRQSLIDIAKGMKPSDMFDVMGERFRTDWFKADNTDWYLGQRFMNSLTAVQYEALADTPYDCFYVNSPYSLYLAVCYLMALELV